MRLTFTWHRDGGGLEGKLMATNVGKATCDITLKPVVGPRGTDGLPLPADFANSAEDVYPHSGLAPGRSAVAEVSWGGWCGAAAGPRADVRFGTERAVTVTVRGPRQPTCPPDGESENLTSGWFDVLG